MTHSSSLATLWKRGTDFLGCEFAILGGAMSWVSERNLVAAMSNAGMFGVIACSSMSPELLDKEITETKKLTQKPFGVNLIVMHPQMDALVEVCKKHAVSHVVFAGGLPQTAHIKTVKDYGGKAIGFAPALVIGKKLIRSGIDALIIEGSEAGGHIGPVSTSVLAQEILPAIREVPVFVAGGIGRGEAMASYLEMGAAGVQLGTRFVCASECIAHPKFKEAFIRASARDAMPSVQVDPDFPVIPVRAIMNKATDDFTRTQHEVIGEFRAGKLDKKEAQLKIEHFWAGALRRAVVDGDIENGSLMAGQSVGMVGKIQPCAEIVAELVAQAEAFLARPKAAAC
ncbi:MAG: nitronate monooxygenase [Alphaproteobacteria bacterium]|nr:nitronate monooxygenase [Alphaproteobacteria bacterium]